MSEEAQEIIDACRDSIAPSVFNPTPSGHVSPNEIKKLIGHKPSEEAMQELVNAGLLRVIGEDVYGENLYYVVEFDAI